ncbi:MAG TPA: response regulator [Verrucomicrobiae bacterium]|nr:response regulator [Verrucomicrobiae bacterium]
MARILVIDDEPAVRGLLSRSLTAAGHTILLAANGQEALAQLVAAPADLVVTDIYMPVQEGLSTIRELRNRFPELPIIAMSGMPLANEMLGIAESLGVKACLKKPFPTDDLLKAIEKALAPRNLKSLSHREHKDASTDPRN